MGGRQRRPYMLKVTDHIFIGNGRFRPQLTTQTRRRADRNPAAQQPLLSGLAFRVASNREALLGLCVPKDVYQYHMSRRDGTRNSHAMLSVRPSWARTKG